LLCLPPEQVMMVAAHNHDLRPPETGIEDRFRGAPTNMPLQKYDFEARAIGTSSQGLWRDADRMGC